MSLWLVLTLVLAIPAWLAIWSRKPSRYRLLSVLAFLIASPAAGAVMIASLGWPAPLYPYISAPSGKVEVLGVKFVPDVAIYLMLEVGTDEPRTFALPWDAEQASKLQRMLEGAEGEGRINVEIKRNGGDAPGGEFTMDKSAEDHAQKPAEAPGIVYQRTN